MVVKKFCKITWLNPLDQITVFQLSKYEILKDFVVGMAHSFFDGFPTNTVLIPINRVLLIDEYLNEEEWRDSETPNYSEESTINGNKRD